jgi:hypothetical protein
VPDEGVLRVVVVRKGKVKPTEFRLREGETGLSLFRLARIFHAYKARMYCAVAELMAVLKVTTIFLLPRGSHRYDRA